MSWHQTTTNTYQRPWGENERLIKFIGDRAHPAGREQWSVSATAIFKPCDSRLATDWAATTLRDAWKLLRFQHPSIASAPADDGENLEYVVPTDEKDLASWVEETFVVAGEDTCAEDVIARVKPSSLMTLYFVPHNWEILLHTSHWRTDGYGAFQLLHAFFEAVKTVIDNDSLPTISWGEEISRLVPSVESALNLPESATQETIAAARKYASTQMYMKDSIGIPYNGDLTTRPGGTRTVRKQLSKETTEALQTAADNRGVDFFSAIHAALAIVNFRNATASAEVASDDMQYASTIRLSLRPHLASPHTDNPSVAAGVYTGGYIFKVSDRSSFDEIARQYQHEYQHGASPEFAASRRQFAAMAVEGLKKGLPLQNPPPSNVDISFVTDADQMVASTFETKAGPLEIVRVGLGVETLTRQPYLFFWKFRGQLDLSVVYNEAYQDDEVAEKILEDLVGVLEKELLV